VDFKKKNITKNIAKKKKHVNNNAAKKFKKKIIHFKKNTNNYT